MTRSGLPLLLVALLAVTARADVPPSPAERGAPVLGGLLVLAGAAAVGIGITLRLRRGRGAADPKDGER